MSDKNKVEATARPWKFKDGEFHFGNDGERYIVHSAPDHEHSQICVVASQIKRSRKTPYDAEDLERDSNAALIVRSVNLHEAYEEVESGLKSLMDALAWSDKQWVGLNMENKGQKAAHEIIQSGKIEAEKSLSKLKSLKTQLGYK